MKVNALVGKYAEDQRIERLEESLGLTPPASVFLSGLVGSATALIASGLIQRNQYSHLFILNDKEEASYFQDDLSRFLPKRDIMLLPDSFRHPGAMDAWSANNIQMRTESMNRFLQAGERNGALVTYPEAIMEKVMDKGSLKKHAKGIKIGDVIDVEEWIAYLNQEHFERTDFVYEPGEYSIRGGIMDIFSFGSEWPYRIELFDIEVESIRTFDPVTQLSEKKLEAVSILPDITGKEGGDQKVSVFDYLPDNLVVWVKDSELILERMRIAYEKVIEISKEEEHPLHGTRADEFFFSPQGFQESLSGQPIIYMSEKKPPAFDHEIKFNMAPQPSFNKNFQMLHDDLFKHEQDKYECILTSENARQFERLHSIFENIEGEVKFHSLLLGISNGFIDHDLKTLLYTDHQIFNRYHRYNLRKGYSRSKAVLMKTLRNLEPGDFITHIDHGVGVYSGLQKIEVNGKFQEAVRIKYKDNDLLYVNINSLHKISKYTGKEGKEPKVNKLGSDAWAAVKRKTKKKIKDIATDLIKLYAERKTAEGFAFHPDTYLQAALESSFVYEDTPDQAKATVDVKEDMEKLQPMDRLVCGDVGFGKTEIAIRAAFKAVADSKQVAVLVPTTILATQHARTFQERLKELPCTVDFINRFRTAKEITQVRKNLEEGKVDILIGTHAILNQKNKFKDLGLLIIDEEQKFGVGAKEKIRQMKANVDTLTLTATPIPRTLQFSLMAARDLSIINTPPPNRQPIQTEVHAFEDNLLKEAIYYEVNRGGQVYLINNRIQNIEEIAALVRQLCPDLKSQVAHGQMEGKELEKVMVDFINQEFDILICTSIVESGLDIANANTMIINNAHHFGLSDLHQLRGRVGRSNQKAFCYLLAPPSYSLTPEARRRLQTLTEFSDLGSGFNIAMRDLDIRGAGNLLGGEQSGFIAEIGFDMYHKILDEAIQDLKQNEFKGLFEEAETEIMAKDCQIETDMEIRLPDEYISNTNERLALYAELDACEKDEDLNGLEEQMIDRFGPLPSAANELFLLIRLRWVARKLGMERLLIKDNKMKAFFINNQESPFYHGLVFGKILEYVQKSPGGQKLRQKGAHLIMDFDEVKDIWTAREKLLQIKNYASPGE